MPSSLAEVLKLLGFATPFLYAAATYYIFHYLDSKASANAKKTISNWIEGIRFEQEATKQALLEVFDRIYTSPLSGQKALLRSTLISAVVGVIVVYELDQIGDWWAATKYSPFMYVAPIAFNMLTDYCSLFLVRYFLVLGRARRNPLFVLLAGWSIGTVFVFCSYIIQYCIGAILAWFFHLNVERVIEEFVGGPFLVTRNILSGGFFQALALGGLAVHLWLPLLALSIFCTQVVNSVLRAVRKTQWFLKAGQQHPLDAIGYVAATIVFLLAVSLQLIVSIKVH